MSNHLEERIKKEAEVFVSDNGDLYDCHFDAAHYLIDFANIICEPLQADIEEKQLALNNATSIIQEKIAEIMNLKKLVRHAWDQAIINCEAENGVGDEPYVSWNKFLTDNFL